MKFYYDRSKTIICKTTKTIIRMLTMRFFSKFADISVLRLKKEDEKP